MSNRKKEVVEETGVVTVDSRNDLEIVNNVELMELFGDKVTSPAIMLYDENKVVPVTDLINLAGGENLSISEILNIEVTLEGFGGVKLEYVDELTGEFGDYIRYILITDKGNFTTTSSFIGRTLKMLFQSGAKKPVVKFTQKDKNVNGEVRRQFRMELVKVGQ